MIETKRAYLLVTRKTQRVAAERCVRAVTDEWRTVQAFAQSPAVGIGGPKT